MRLEFGERLFTRALHVFTTLKERSQIGTLLAAFSYIASRSPPMPWPARPARSAAAAWATKEEDRVAP